MNNNDNAFSIMRKIHLAYCNKCGGTVQIANHTKERCDRIRSILEAHRWQPEVAEKTEVPSAFYRAFEGEVNDA